MAAISKAVHLCVGQVLLPFHEEVVVEDEVLVAPTDHDRFGVKLRQIVLDIGDEVVADVARFERDILDEAQSGDAIVP